MGKTSNQPYYAPYEDCANGTTGQSMTCEVWVVIRHTYYNNATGQFDHTITWGELPMDVWASWQAQGSYGPWLQNITFTPCTNTTFQDTDYGVDQYGQYRTVTVETEQRNCTTTPPTN
jgi:hypothetical protein